MKEGERLKKSIKTKIYGSSMVVAGNFIIEGKHSALTRYAVPDELKAKYKETDPTGKWSFKVTKMSANESS